MADEFFTPEEFSVADIVKGINEDWADRVTVAKLLKAFGVEPCGKKIGPDGGRPAVMYPADKVILLIEHVRKYRGTF